jgi:hypothetical protein
VKAIGIIVLLLVVGLGAVTLMITKEPDRTLDAQGQTWLDEFRAWSESVSTQVTTAERGMSFGTPQKNARLLAPLRSCGRTLAQVGEPPTLLKDVKTAGLQACGQAQVALAKNEEFGQAAYATMRLHLAEVSDQLRLAERSITLALEGPS